MSIKYKVLIPVITMSVLIAFIFLGTFYVADKQKSDGLVVNLAGRQRMLSQRLAKDLLLINLHQKDNEKLLTYKSEAYNTIRLFETTHNALRGGGPAPVDMFFTAESSLPVPDEKIIAHLDTVQKIWTEYKYAALNIMSNPNDTKAINFIQNHSNELLSSLDTAVILLQDASDKRNKSLIYFQLFSACVTVFVVILLAERLSTNISNPIMQLCRKVKNSDGTSPLDCAPVGTGDELEILAEALDEKSLKLSQAYSEIAMYSQSLEELVEGRTRELLVARHSAEDANRRKSSFLANMSHEIRTPLHAVIGFNQILMRSAKDEKTMEYLKKSQKSAYHLLGTINDILDFSMIESGSLKPENVSFSIRKLMENISLILQEKADEKSLRLIVSVDDKVPEYLISDPLRIAQILLNLGVNAVRFTNKGHVKITASVESVGDFHADLRFTVEDTGIGIREEIKDSLFRPFEQIDPTTPRMFGGTGLGLSIVSGLLRILNGTVDVESKWGEGAVFTVRLSLDTDPNYGADADPDDSLIFMLNQNRPGEFSLNISALLVEDNKINQMVALDIMRSAGINTTLAENGKEALEIMEDEERASTFDIILMDLQMPVMDGLDAARAIKKLPHCKDAVIIALTADAVAERRTAAITAGMNDFLPKPFTRKDLKNIIQKWIPQPD
ncbi:MAG: ATP-binding protein [Deferribacterales bacterium]